MKQITRIFMFSMLCFTLVACSSNDDDGGSAEDPMDDDQTTVEPTGNDDGDTATGADGDTATGADGDTATGADGDTAAGADGDTAAGADGDTATGADGDTATGADGDTATGADGAPVVDDAPVDDDAPVVATIDTDEDGVSDEDEIIVGTDPMNADSDGDGTIDGEDTFPNASSELDSDGDTISDQDEELLGLDSDNPDSDGDGVNDGDDPHPNASSMLDSDGDGLSDEEELVAGTDQENPDSDGDGIEDGSDPFPTNPNPDGVSTDDDDSTGTDTDDGTGTDTDAGTDANADTDNDGLTDAEEVEMGLDPTTADTDADGVNDGDDPFPNDASASVDTDGDGVDDGRDEFPNDPTETSDLNGDGLGDNANPFDGTTISGVVLDPGQAPVAGAQVSLDLMNNDTGANPVAVATTDADGAFTLVGEGSSLPDSFVVVTSQEGSIPVATVLENSGDAIEVEEIGLETITDNFIMVEPSPTLHHLGDDISVGAANSQFQRAAEGMSFERNFNVPEALANAETLELIWVAKGVQTENLISVNGAEVATTTPNTNADGSFSEQIITLDVNGVLNAGSNTLLIEAVEFDTLDDFEFVLIGLQAP